MLLKKQSMSMTATDKTLLHENVKPRGNKKLELDDLSPRTLIDNGIFFFNSMVDGGSIGDAIQFILEANLDQECDWPFITIIVNSPGGYVTDGFALIDIMNSSTIPIRTLGIGMIASMGLMIFLAGEKGNRTLTNNCMVLSHQFSGVTFGKEHELISGRDEMDNTSEIIMRHYKRTTGLTEARIKEL